MEQYYLALNPEKKLIDLINKQKALVKKIMENQKYVQDPPHFTLTIFTTDNLKELIKELDSFSKKISEFKVKINDFHIFYNDPWTKGHTLTYSLSKENLCFLREIQLRVIDAIERFNTKKFNYPFIGDIWIPHITIASINPDKFDSIFEIIKENPVYGDFLIDSINLYQIKDETSFLIKSFKLG